MTNDSNDDKLINFFPMTDEQILAKWTVDELDMLHNISGMGIAWLRSDRRARLVKIENHEIETLNKIVDRIVDDQKVSRCYSTRVIPDSKDESERTIAECQLVDHGDDILHYHQQPGQPEIFWRWRNNDTKKKREQNNE